MTSDRDRFIECADAERDGYQRQPDGMWSREAGDPLLRPLYQGAMIYDLNPNAHAYAGGTGRAVRWRNVNDPDEVAPRYLVRADERSISPPARTVVRALSNATNQRTVIACLLGDEPCGNSLGVLTPAAPTHEPVGNCAWLAGLLGSMVWDWSVRQRLAGTNLNGFVLSDTVLPPANDAQRHRVANLALQLCAVMPWHTHLWTHARSEGWLSTDAKPARTTAARNALRAQLELAVVEAFQLRQDDLAWILRDCDHPPEALRDNTFTRNLNSRGFWRVDRDLAPEERLPQRVLALATQS